MLQYAPPFSFKMTYDNLTLSVVIACENPSPWPGAWNFLCFIICAIFFDVFQFHTSKNFFKNSLHPLSTYYRFLLQLSIIRMLSDLSTANNTVQKILYNDYYDDMDWQLHITEWICLYLLVTAFYSISCISLILSAFS